MLGLLCFLLCLRKSVLVVIIGTVHGGELGIFLGVAKITLVFRDRVHIGKFYYRMGVRFSSPSIG